MRTYINCQALLPIVVIAITIMLYISNSVLKTISKPYNNEFIDHQEYAI